MDDSPATRKLAEAGRLSQICPDCGVVEAAGRYCTACSHLTGPADWLVQASKSHPRATDRPVVAGREEPRPAVSLTTDAPHAGFWGF